MKRRSDNSNEIAFADVSMALVGPILILFVIYLILSASWWPPPIGQCPVLADADIKVEARKLLDWKEAAEKDQTIDDADLALNCQGQHQIGQNLIPPVLDRFCPIDRARIVEATPHKTFELEQLAGRRLATLTLLRACKRKVVVPGPTIVRANFKFDTLDLVKNTNLNAQTVMTEAEIDAFADMTANTIIDVLKNPEKFIGDTRLIGKENLPSKESINLIEFAGHTDDVWEINKKNEKCQNPIESACGRFNDNYDLSYNRAKYIMRLVEKRLRDDDDLKYRFEKSHTNRLHIVVVGAADEVPKDGVPVIKNSRLTPSQIKQKRGENRRIEVRYLSDDRLRGKSVPQ